VQGGSHRRITATYPHASRQLPVPRSGTRPNLPGTGGRAKTNNCSDKALVEMYKTANDEESQVMATMGCEDQKLS